jgi:predicted metal-binding membrane protein
MERAPTNWLLVQRNVILGLLLALAAAAWALLAWQGAGADANLAMASPTMGMHAPLFLAVWVVMMVAMMFPTAAPMILIFHQVQTGRRRPRHRAWPRAGSRWSDRGYRPLDKD